MSDNIILPVGWALPNLGSIALLSKVKANPPFATDIKYIGLEHIEAQTTKLLGYASASTVKSTKAVFRAGDVLYGKLRPYLNKVCIAPFDGICSTDIYVLRESDILKNAYLVRFMNTPEFVAYANHHMAGVQLPRISFEALSSVTIPLPPVSEQERISSKLNRLLPAVDNTRSRLNNVAAIIKRFRQSVLAAACMGNLTEDWRERNGVKLHRSIMSSGSHSELFIGIPANWTLTYAKDVCIKITDGEHLTPKRTSTGGLLLSAKRFRDGYIDYADHDFIAIDDFNKCLKRCNPEIGDVLIVSVGATIGRTAIVREKQKFAIVRSVGLFRPNNTVLLSEYLLHTLRSPIIQKIIGEESQGTAQPCFYINKMEQMPIPLPPIAEQREIALRVKALFALADKIEKRLQTVTARADKLTQSILAKAFRGELVPTEAELAAKEGRTYETAEELLQKLKTNSKINRIAETVA